MSCKIYVSYFTGGNDMDENRLKDELLARLVGEVDRPMLQVIDGALSSVLRDYDVKRKETQLSTNIVSFPELDLFLGRMQYRNCAKGTIRQYRSTLMDFLVYVNKPVQQIDDGDIIEFLNAYEASRNIKKRTKDGKRRIISSFFTYLLNNGYLPHGNPMTRVDPIDYTKTVRQALTPREVEKLRIACRNNIRDNVVLELFLATGCRVSEVVDMRLENMDLKEECVKVHGKGDKERIVFLGARAIEFLEQYLGNRREGPVILSCRAPYQGLKKNALENIVRAIAHRAGLERRVFPHLLRHTFATRALNKGMPLAGLCDLMGHASVETTRIYAKNSRQKLKYDYDLYVSA